MNTKELSTRYLTELKDLLDRFDHESLEKIVDLILSAYEKENHIFVMGNGGSGSTASHFACDINKGCCMDLDKKFKMICVNDSIPTMLALANDVSYDVVFVEQMKNFFIPGDRLFVRGEETIRFCCPASWGRTRGWTTPWSLYNER